jgi:ribosomal protein L22
MEANDFVRDLNEAQELMRNEKYKEALILLGKLKEADKAGSFDYNLTHKLYQLISNSQSLYNQQRVLSVVKKISQNQKSISFIDLKVILNKQENVELDEQVLRREVEILILRSLLESKIEGNDLIF